MIEPLSGFFLRGRKQARTIRPTSLFLLFLIAAPGVTLASTGEAGPQLTDHWVGITSLLLFAVAYVLVMAEEFTHLRKSKPVILIAGIMWALIAWVTQGMDGFASGAAAQAMRHNLLEYAELMLFLLVAMTYINAMEERNVFDALRSWLVHKGFSFRQMFWITGVFTFFISPIADNLTTALLMCAVVMAVGVNNRNFTLIACVNIVVAANAGGAFSPFGDITTLMVWQKEIATPQGTIDFWSFFVLFVPSLVNWLIPAAIMHFFVPNGFPPSGDHAVPLKRGAKRIVVLFLLTIVTAVGFHNFLHMPPVLGMLTGLAYLQFFGYYLKKTSNIDHDDKIEDPEHEGRIGDPMAFDVFTRVAGAEWDTLLFFYGVVLCVGGLGFLGYLTFTSEVMYGEWGATYANIFVGVLSAVVDNIPVMFAVLTMLPDMSMGQWMLVTMTAGVGGSLLSIGSAAGVALMGQARGIYTFFGHLKWTPAIALGYGASILTHQWINGGLF